MSTNRKYTRLAIRFGIWFLVIFLTINLILGILINLPFFQTRIAQLVTSKLSKELNTEVSIKRVQIKFLSNIQFQDLLIKDQKNDTLAFIPDFRMDVLRIGIRSNKIKLGEITLNGGYLNIYRNVQDSTFNHRFIEDYLSLRPQKGKSSDQNWKISFTDIYFLNGRFRYHDYQQPESPGRFNASHLDFPQFSIVTKGIKTFEDQLTMEITRSVLRSSDAFSVNKLVGKLTIGDKGIRLQNLFLNTNLSEIKGDLSLNYNRWSDLNHFDSLVSFNGSLQKVLVHPADLAFFLGGSPITAPFEFSGNVNGTISNLNAKNLQLKSGKNLIFNGNLTLKGLPNINNTFIDFKTNKFKVNRSELTNLISEISFPNAIDAIQNLDFVGSFTGYLNKFKADGKINTNLGQLTSNLSVNVKGGLPFFDGSLGMFNFDLGKLLKEPLIGTCTFETQLNGSGNTLNNLEAVLNGKLQYAWINRYKYQGFNFQGFFSKKRMEGKIESKDPNVRFNIAGFADFSGPKPDFDVEAAIQKLDLKALKLSTDSGLVAGIVKACFKGSTIDDADGNLHFNQFRYKNQDKTLFLNDLEISSHFDKDGFRTVEAFSDDMFLEMLGNFSLEQLPSTMQAYVSQFLPKRFDRKVSTENNWFTFRLEAKNQKDIIDFFTPSQFDLGTIRLQGRFDGRSNRVIYNGEVSHLGLNNSKINNLKFTGRSSNDTLYLNTKTSAIVHNDSTLVNSFESDQIFSDNHLFVDFKTQTTNQKNGIQAGVLLDFTEPEIKIVLDQINLKLGKNIWKAKQTGPIFFFDNILHIANLDFLHANQLIGLRGAFSTQNTDTLGIQIENFDLEQLNPWLSMYKTRLEGQLNAQLSAASILKSPFFTGQLSLSEFALDGKPIGDIIAKSNYDPSLKIAKIDAALLTNSDTLGIVYGAIDFSKKTESIDFTAVLKQATITPLNKLLEPEFREATGYVSANMRITGSLNDPIVTGNAFLEKGSILVDYLNTTYYLSQWVTFEPEAIVFNNLPITDGENGTGILSGRILHNHFRNTRLDLRIDCQNMLALNTQKSNDLLFFGRSKASGFATFKGHLSNFDIYIAATTRPGTRMHILVDDKLSFSKIEYIKFVNRRQRTDTVVEKKTFALEKIGFLMDLTITPDAEAILLLDEVSGDKIRGFGTGQMKLEYDRNGDFQMFGNYNINQGDYLFTFENLINKKFEINQGGVIRWSGDPYLAQIDIQAIYKVRTYLNPLLIGAGISAADTSRFQNSRYPVDLYLRMNGFLTKPDIGFEIKIPTFTNNDLGNPVVQQLRNINANEPELNKQVFGLLMLNQFIANDLSSSSSVTTGVNSVSELISNQLSNLLSQYAGNVNIGINYRENAGTVGNANRRDVQVALNTSLFNNRLVIDGNVGVGNNPAVNNAQGVGADFNLEYKLTEDGRLRALAFNKLDDRILVNRDLNYRQGVGLSYRQSFEEFEDLYAKPIKELNRMINETFGFLWGRKKNGKNRTVFPFPLPPARIEPVIEADSLPSQNNESK